MEGNSDIIDKLKASVIAKLEELDPSTNRDATLIDYIIVMIVNQKSKFEMKHNLSLFLGKIVDEFVNWLFDYLATTSELKVKTASPTAAAVLNATTSTSSSSSSSRTTTKNSPKSTSSPKETEKSKKSEPIADSKANTATITNGHSSSSSSQEATSKGDPSKKSTSRRKLKSAVSASSTDDKETTAETGVATSPVNTTNNNNNSSSSTADATTKTTASSPTRKNGKVVKRRPAAEAVSYASGSRKRTQSNSATTDNINDEEMGGGGSGAKKSRQKKTAADDDEEDVEMLDLDADSKENNETKFLITLDGAKDMFKDTQDGLLLDEDFDPELMNEDLSNFGGKNYPKNSGNGSSNGSPSKNHHHHQNGVSHSLDMSAMITESNGGGNSKSTERCKYWPACLNGDQCEFFHPVTKCNNFPYCRFGDKCLYIHPTCKFDSYCTRKDCNFMHTAKVRGPPMHQMYPSTVRHHHPMMMYGGMGMGMGMGMPPMSTSNVTCKFFPNCMKPACEFFHPKVCHYGAACTSVNCPFVHLPSQAVAPVLPSALAPAAPTAVAALHTSKFKWSSSRKAAAASAMDEF